MKHVRRRAPFLQYREAIFQEVFFLPGKAHKETHAIQTETSGEHAPTHATVKTWWPSLNEVIYPTCFAPRPGRYKTVTNPEILLQIQDLI